VLFGRKKKDKETNDAGQGDRASEQKVASKPEKKSGGLFARLSKTREALTSGVVGLFGGGRKVDAALFDSLEDELLMADVGVAKADGQDVMLAAADTFRAAAIEQLQEWGGRLDIPVVAQSHGSDAAAVAFDALSSARARSADQLIIDTAGRQHTHDDLMEQLGKIERVLKRNDSDAPHETLITLDAANGQNVLVQIEQFSAQTPITGVVVSKLDGTAKGGVVFAIARKFGLPIRYIGVGEGVEDLRPFDVEAFVDALLPAADDLGGGNSA